MPENKHDSDDSDQAEREAACIESLRALAAGELDRFMGIDEHCTRAAVAAAFGPSQHDVDSVVGTAGPFREYSPTQAAPNGIRVVFHADADRVRYVLITEAVPTQPLGEVLGAPEVVADAKLRGTSQHVYASRGLTAYVRRRLGTIRRLYAYQPMTVDDYLETDMAAVELRREPKR